MALAVANRYAVALGEVVTKAGSGVSAEATLSQLQSFWRLFQDSQDLRNVLTSPVVEPAKKRSLVEILAGRLELSRPVRNLLYVVIDNRRVGLLAEIISAFRDWRNEKLGIAELEVQSASAIGEPQRTAVLEKFQRVTGRRVQSEFQVVPELLGGATVRYGSTVFDGSLRAQLRALDRALAGER